MASRPGELWAGCSGGSCSICGPGSPHSPWPSQFSAIASTLLSYERLLRIRGMKHFDFLLITSKGTDIYIFKQYLKQGKKAMYLVSVQQGAF